MLLQGYHNYLLSSGAFAPWAQRSIEEVGPVMTLGSYDELGETMEGPGDNVQKGYTLFRRDEDGHVLLRDGSKAAAIHQYTAFWHQVEVEAFVSCFDTTTNYRLFGTAFLAPPFWHHHPPGHSSLVAHTAHRCTYCLLTSSFCLCVLASS